MVRDGDLVRRALRISALSAVWTLTSSTVAVAIGLAHDSLALIVFGAVAAFDCASDTVLVVHFRAEQRGRSAERLEHVALQIVSVGLAAVGIAAVAFSFNHLRDRAAAESSTEAVVLAAASFVVLAVLAIRKRHIAMRLPSPGLEADGELTAVGAVLAAVTLGGAASASAFDWWWADPAAALITGLGAIGLSAATAREWRQATA
jgi:divalent metal cation (Fe/Co/Zn/Cd) transporter